MEPPLKISDRAVIPGFELWFTASRSGGPGGQHVNKTSSRVTLHWNIKDTIAFAPEVRELLMRRLGNRVTLAGVLCLHVDDSRSQHQNRLQARLRLVELIKGALVMPKKRVPTKVSKGAKRRRVANKRKRSLVKDQRRKPSDQD